MFIDSINLRNDFLDWEKMIKSLFCQFLCLVFLSNWWYLPYSKNWILPFTDLILSCNFPVANKGGDSGRPALFLLFLVLKEIGKAQALRHVYRELVWQLGVLSPFQTLSLCFCLSKPLQNTSSSPQTNTF